MKINVISDLHLFVENMPVARKGQDPDELKSLYSGIKPAVEWNLFNPDLLHPADYLVIAGDIGYEHTRNFIIKELKKRTSDKFKDILYVFGNHDWWSFRSTGRRHPDRYLDFVDGDYAFIGCTMWSPIPDYASEYVSYAMNDFAHILDWSVDEQNRVFRKESDWLRKKAEFYKNAGKKVVVVTHHNPNGELIPEYYRGSLINSSYTVLDGSVDDIRPDVWICGHTHVPFDSVINGVRYIRNPIGYHGSWYGHNPEIPQDHWYDFVIDI